MKKKKAGIILMTVGILVALCGISLTAGIPDRVEYIIQAPEASPEMSANDRLEELDSLLDGIQWTAAWRTVNGTAQSEHKEKTRVTVYAVPEGFFDLRHMSLRAGRYISGEDVKGHLLHTVITRRTATDFFLSEDPTGQVLICNDLKLEIVGVIEDATWIGEPNTNVIFIPATLTDMQKLNAETMEIRVKASSEAEKTIVGSILKTWSPNGTLYNYSRLKMTVLMPVWFLMIIFGLLLVIVFGRAVYRAEKNLVLKARERLKTSYFRECRVFCFRQLIIGTAMAALWAGCIWALISLAVKPLYVYTDWIPEAFVDPEAILATGRNVLLNSSVSVIYRSRETAVFDLSASFTRFGSFAFACGLAVLFIHNFINNRNE